MFDAGRIAFADGRFADALASFQRAYDLSHRPLLLYNIGQCHDRMRHDAEALAAFEQFLHDAPDAPQASEVRGRVEFLQAAAAHPTETSTTAATTTTTTAAPPPTTTTSARTSSSDPGVVPWVLIGSGAAVAIVGAVLVGVGYGDIGSVQNAADGTRYASVRDADQQAPILTGVGFAAIGVGLATAAVGVVLFATAGGGGHEAQATLRIVPNGLELRGVF